MKATVVYPYRDKGDLEVRYVGDCVELTDERFATLRAKGYVQAAEPPAAAPEEAAEEPGAPEQEPADKPEEAEASEKTAAQLRAEIEAKGGFAPKRATKAQLADILGTL